MMLKVPIAYCKNSSFNIFFSLLLMVMNRLDPGSWVADAARAERAEW